MTSRKVSSSLALFLLAILPVYVGTMQLAHFLSWLFDWGYESSIWGFTEVSFPILAICFFVSILERFCVWYRITIVGTLYLNASCFILDYFPSVLSYNITNFVADIASANGTHLNGETVAYLAGDIAHNLSPSICSLSCNHCRRH